LIHAHVTTWFIGLILFFIAVNLQKKQKHKGAKIIHMILRLFYLLILGTGAYLTAVVWGFYSIALLKAVVGLWIIFSMEFVLTRGGKGEKTSSFWVQLVIGLIIVFVLGYGVLG
jgi:hypothetical protein